MIGNLTAKWQGWLLEPERGSAICDASVRICWERIDDLSRSVCQLAILTCLVFRVCHFKSVISSLSILLNMHLRKPQKPFNRNCVVETPRAIKTHAVSPSPWQLHWNCDIRRKEEPKLGRCQGLCIDFETSIGCDADDHRASSGKERTARKDIKAFPPPSAQ